MIDFKNVLRRCSRVCLAGLWLLLVFEVGYTQDSTKCKYDKMNPSLESAQKFYRAHNYDCAASELNDLLGIDTINARAKADAHIWLGIIYYKSLQDKIQQYDSALTQFLKALQSLPSYKGPLESDSTGLGTVFRDAKDSLSRIENWRQRREQDSLASVCSTYQRDSKRSRLMRIATGIGVAGAVTGILLLDAKANNYYDTYQAAVDPVDIQSSWDGYKNRLKWRNYMVGAASGLALLEVLWFTHKPHKPDFNCTSYQEKPKSPVIGFSTDGKGIQLVIWVPGL